MDKKQIAISGAGLSEKCKARLASYGFHLISLPPYDRLGQAVSSHADLLIFIMDGKIFTYGEYMDKNTSVEKELSDTGCEIIRISQLPDAKYPHDVYLNALRMGSRIFARLDCFSDTVREYAGSMGYETVNIRQGYARCTAVPLSDSAIITADPSIARKARELGIDLLTISEGSVLLRGYDHGFIGGACGVFGDRVFFAGDLYSHPDGERIAKFCKMHSKTALSLSDEPLCDVGSILFVE